MTVNWSLQPSCLTIIHLYGVSVSSLHVSYTCDLLPLHTCIICYVLCVKSKTRCTSTNTHIYYPRRHRRAFKMRESLKIWRKRPSYRQRQRDRRKMEGKKEGGQAEEWSRKTEKYYEEALSLLPFRERKPLIVAAGGEHGERRPLLAVTQLTARQISLIFWRRWGRRRRRRCGVGMPSWYDDLGWNEEGMRGRKNTGSVNGTGHKEDAWTQGRRGRIMAKKEGRWEETYGGESWGSER